VQKVKLLKDQADSLTLLYVEDNGVLRTNLSEFFNNFFLLVDTAEDGKLGLEKYKDFKDRTGNYYDIVITDQYMPNISGSKMSEEIKSIHQEQAIVVISAHDDATNLLEFINLNVNHFITKPIVHKKVIDVLLKVCREINDYSFLEKYHKDIDTLTDELAAKNIQLEKTVRFYKNSIELLKTDSLPKVQKNTAKIEHDDSSLQKDIHVSHNDQISAVEFIKTLDDSMIDKIEGFLHELDRLVMIVYDIEDSNSAQVKEQISKMVEIFDEFIRIVDALVSFPLIVRAFQTYREFLENLDLSFTEDKAKKKLFVNLLLGLSGDLESWIKNVFIDRIAIDINYLDASFANNCLTIEKQFTKSEDEDEDEDDLELF